MIETAKERVEKELEQLRERHHSLVDFISSNEAFDKLSVAQRVLLRAQRDVMETYQSILQQRLLYWED